MSVSFDGTRVSLNAAYRHECCHVYVTVRLNVMLLDYLLHVI